MISRILLHSLKIMLDFLNVLKYLIVNFYRIVSNEFHFKNWQSQQVLYYYK